MESTFHPSAVVIKQLEGIASTVAEISQYRILAIPKENKWVEQVTTSKWWEDVTNVDSISSLEFLRNIIIMLELGSIVTLDDVQTKLLLKIVNGVARYKDLVNE